MTAQHNDTAPGSLAALIAPEYIEWLALLDPGRAPDLAEGKRLPDAQEYRALVDEAALGYYADKELCHRFGIQPAVLKELQQHPSFARDVLAVRKEQDGDEAAVRTLARREVRDAIGALSKVIKADSTHELKKQLDAVGVEFDLETLVSMMPTVSNRIKAVEQLRHLAGLGAQTTVNAGATVIPLQLTTNLTMGQQADVLPGHYTAVAEPVSVEHRTPARAAKREQPTDDFSDLLGRG